MSTKEFDIIEVSQPIGTFYLTKIVAAELYNCVCVNPRRESSDGVQRVRSKERVSEIARYCSDPDATFPSAIIVSINDDCILTVCNNHLVIQYEGPYFGDVIDGQHRLYGIAESDKKNSIELPIVLMPGLDIEEKAYVFSIINSKQEKVDKSLIYELFDVSKSRSPQKTAHEIASIFNTREDSPFYHRLKMLGKKEPDQPDAVLSQGTFAKRILNLISSDIEEDRLRLKNNQPLYPDSKRPLRQYFIEERDDVIFKILFNCFSALRNVFPSEWNEQVNEDGEKYILCKTTGYNAIIDALPFLIQIGREQGTLSLSFFTSCFQKFRNKLSKENLQLVRKYFGPGESDTKKLKDFIISSMDEVLM